MCKCVAGANWRSLPSDNGDGGRCSDMLSTLGKFVVGAE